MLFEPASETCDPASDPWCEGRGEWVREEHLDEHLCTEEESGTSASVGARGRTGSDDATGSDERGVPSGSK